MRTANPDTEELLERAASGDPQARQLLLARHRQRLQRMVAVHLDRRLAARLDPSDVVQEALAAAAHQLDNYLRDRPLPFYPWLRRLAWERLVKLHRRHIDAGRRSVTREESPPLPDDSALELADRLLTAESGPAEAALREELRQRVRAALAQLTAGDREVLVLRFLERLATADVAVVLGLTPGAVKLRQMRALERLRCRLGDDGSAKEPS
jgi:RNA polymerase sigma-70 factor (ECF subfamily)